MIANEQFLPMWMWIKRVLFQKLFWVLSFPLQAFRLWRPSTSSPPTRCHCKTRESTPSQSHPTTCIAKRLSPIWSRRWDSFLRIAALSSWPDRLSLRPLCDKNMKLFWSCFQLLLTKYLQFIHSLHIRDLDILDSYWSQSHSSVTSKEFM